MSSQSDDIVYKTTEFLRAASQYIITFQVHVCDLVHIDICVTLHNYCLIGVPVTGFKKCWSL